MPHFGLVFEVGETHELYGMYFEGVPHFSSLRFPWLCALAAPRLLTVASQMPDCGVAAGVTATSLIFTLARTPEATKATKLGEALEM